jgi:hypothetical protein
MKTLFEQFNEMEKYPIIEINLKDYGLSEEDEYVIYNITASEEFLMSDNISLFWDKDSSLDENLQYLFNCIIKRLYNEKEDN